MNSRYSWAVSGIENQASQEVCVLVCIVPHRVEHLRESRVFLYHIKIEYLSSLLLLVELGKYNCCSKSDMPVVSKSETLHSLISYKKWIRYREPTIPIKRRL